MVSRSAKLKSKITPKPTAAKKKAATPPTENMEKPFGPVGRLATAPVNIGTTIRSVPVKTHALRDGVVITGRDFIGSIMGVSTTYNNWVFSGGFPVTPAALTASALKGFFLTYQVFKVRKLDLHYISSSPTSASGDIMLMHHDNRAGPYVDHTSSNFMSYVLSSPSAVLGPQWLNKSVSVLGTDSYGWLATDIYNSEDVQHQAAGEVLVYTKNTTNGTQADSPGYLLIDYEIEFMKKMVNPRSVTLPSSLGKIWVSSALVNAAAVTGAQVLLFNFGGTTYDGTTGTAPPGIANGDIFKIGCDTSLSASWTNVSVNTLAIYTASRNDVGVAVNSEQLVFKTGMTLYGVYDSGGGNLIMYANYDSALSGNALRYGTNATVTWTMPFWMSLVGSTTSVFSQSSI